MNEDLIKQLKNLKQVKPEKSWKEENREFLLSQISKEQEEKLELTLTEKVSEKFSYALSLFKTAIIKPAWVGVAAIVLLVLGGGAMVQASSDAKPGSFLYYARIVKEKAQLATTFDKEEKTKMGIKFASEHAKDITEVMNNPGFRDEEATQKLSHDFEQRLESVKSGLKNIGDREEENEESEEKDKREKNNSSNNKKEDGPSTPSASSEQEGSGQGNDTKVAANDTKEDEKEEETGENNSKERDDDEEFFSVESGKDNDGFEVFEPGDDKNENDTIENQEDFGTMENGEEESVATSETATASIGDKVSDKLADVENLAEENGYSESDKLSSLIGEAEQLFKNKEYDKAREKIEEFMSIIDNTQGEVRGAEETSTSTDESEDDQSSTTPEKETSSTTKE